MRETRRIYIALDVDERAGVDAASLAREIAVRLRAVRAARAYRTAYELTYAEQGRQRPATPPRHLTHYEQ